MKEQENIYERAGLMRPIGFGGKPALLVVDLQKALTDPTSPLGYDLDMVVGNVLTILDLARKKNVFVIFVVIEYEDGCIDAGYWKNKIPALSVFQRGSGFVSIDQRLKPLKNEYIIVKKFPSAFFGTNLGSLLTSYQVDTVITTGCATSGCIRATVVDALQYGFRPIIPSECVGDRSKEAHEYNLFEMNAKYCDVLSLAEVKRYINLL